MSEDTTPVAAPEAPKRSVFRWLDRRISSAAYRAVMTFHKPLLFLDFYLRAYKKISGEHFDVVHAHDLNTLPVAAAVSRRNRAKLVYDSHELYTEISTLSRLERRIWRTVERCLIKRADVVVTVCDSIAQELAGRYAIKSPRVVLNCPPAVQLPTRDTSRLRTRAGLEGSDEPIVLYQGGFAVHRGLPELIEAAAYLDRGVIVLMGWGTLEADLRQLISGGGLDDKVRIIPPVPNADLLQYTQGADIGVIPYMPVGLNNYYTTPNKLFEYIAAGLPIVGSRVPELERFLEGQGLGVTFDPAEPQDLGHALNYLLSEPRMVAEMRARALAAGRRLTWETQQAALLRAYSET